MNTYLGPLLETFQDSLKICQGNYLMCNVRIILTPLQMSHVFLGVILCQTTNVYPELSLLEA